VNRLATLAIRSGLALGLAVVVGGAVACSSSNNSAKSSPSPGASTTGVVDASGNITIVGRDNFFEPKQFSGPAGQQITVKLDNQGTSIHNFAIKGQKGPDGQDIGVLTLVNAKQTGTVTFTLPAGTYDFYCSVHPAEMTGTFTLK
jgi:plastocyanin